MKRILAMLLSVICVLSFTCVSTYADEKSEDGCFYILSLS